MLNGSIKLSRSQSDELENSVAAGHGRVLFLGVTLPYDIRTPPRNWSERSTFGSYAGVAGRTLQAQDNASVKLCQDFGDDLLYRGAEAASHFSDAYGVRVPEL